MWIWLGVVLAAPLDDALAGLEAIRADPAGAPGLTETVASAREAGVLEIAADAVLASEKQGGDFGGDTAFAVGMRYWRQGDGAEAVAWFERVPAESDAWPVATLLRARAKRAEDLLKSAVMLCRDVVQWKGETEDPEHVEFVKDLAIVELASIYERVEIDKSIEYYGLLPKTSELQALAQSRIAYRIYQQGALKSAEKALAKVPDSGVWFPEISAIEAEITAARCKKKSSLPASIEKARARVEALRAKLDSVSHPSDLPERQDLWIPSDLHRLYGEIETLSEGSSGPAADYAADLELNSELWLRVQIGLEASRADRALERIGAAAARCGGDK